MSIVITQELLKNLTTAYKASFTSGLQRAPGMYKTFCTVVPSTTAENIYAWLKMLPRMREWIGARQVKNLEANGYRLANKPYEATIGVPKTSIEDDQFGVFAPFYEMMGEAAGAQPDELAFATLLAGFSTNCFDGQFFFDTDHPVKAEDGTEISVSNMQAGAGAPWFLMDLSGLMKPLIFQERKKPVFVARDNLADPAVFDLGEYRYGVDSRNACGYGFWQKAFGSKAALTQANFTLAYDAMRGFKGDEGAKLNIKPTHLFCGTANRAAAENIIKKTTLAGGEGNIDYGRVIVVDTNWLD